MTKEEYQQSKKELETEHSEKLSALAGKYAVANNPYKIGDKFTDHGGTILIEKITFSKDGGSGFPCAVYFGKELKVDGTSKKNNAHRKAWQSNEQK